MYYFCEYMTCSCIDHTPFCCHILIIHDSAVKCVCHIERGRERCAYVHVKCELLLLVPLQTEKKRMSLVKKKKKRRKSALGQMAPKWCQGENLMWKLKIRVRLRIRAYPTISFLVGINFSIHFFFFKVRVLKLK